MDEKKFFETADETLRRAERQTEEAGNRMREELIQETLEGERCLCGCEREYCHCREIFPWLGFLGLSFLAMWLGNHFMNADSINWFRSLIPPLFAPPIWIFPFIWTIMYFLLGTAMWITWWRAGCRRGIVPLVLFFILLTLQILSPYFFFHQHDPFLTFICNLWIFATLVILAAVMAVFSRCAPKLLVPQMIWMIYLISMTYSYWRVNL
ncbi:MAG: TspO/MBR family protein [Planctomycetia bacterium]|nr:TspO/MBR family protein [Planctomycetia bacterium]